VILSKKTIQRFESKAGILSHWHRYLIKLLDRVPTLGRRLLYKSNEKRASTTQQKEAFKMNCSCLACLPQVRMHRSAQWNRVLFLIAVLFSGINQGSQVIPTVFPFTQVVSR
jgi:hypothetical protein